MTDSESAPMCSAELLGLLRSGDEMAAQEAFERYAERLTWLARSRLSARLATRIDPEDIVQSAYRSFFMAARVGRFQISGGGDLWRLLVELTLHKLYRQAAHHGAQRRSIAREVSLDDSVHPAAPPASPEPTPDEAVAAAEELEAVLGQLSAKGREALELRLQGYEHEEIAERLKCSERTVRRWLTDARRIMTARGGGDFIPSAARRVPSTTPRPRAAAAAAIESPLAWNDFLLHEQIGAGATGRVYRALWRSRNQEVAIKFLRKSLVSEPAVVERFLREAQTVVRLADPGIVAMHGAGRTPGGGYYLVLELVRGRDLGVVLQQQPVDPLQAANWVAQAAHIVQAAHSLGVIHCDLKPGNLLLDEAGRIRVTDFGLAVWQNDPQSTAHFAGTPAFMAPEQADPTWGTVSPRTDVYGLGAVLYFLLFRRPPHIGATVGEVLQQVTANRAVEIPPNTTDAAATGLYEVLRKCLAKPPAERIGSAAELAAALLGGDVKKRVAATPDDR